MPADAWPHLRAAIARGDAAGPLHGLPAPVRPLSAEEAAVVSEGLDLGDVDLWRGVTGNLDDYVRREAARHAGRRHR